MSVNLEFNCVRNPVVKLLLSLSIYFLSSASDSIEQGFEFSLW